MGRHTVSTTFNMDVDLKVKAKVHVANHNKEVDLNGSGEKMDMGKLLQIALIKYLDEREDDRNSN